jgi:hypothetical protein
LHEWIHATLFFGLNVVIAIEALYRPAKTRRESTAIKSSYRADATHTCKHIVPSCVDGAANRRDDT